MATINLEGTVTNVFSKGIRVTEKTGERETRYTVWAGKAAEGDRVQVAGKLSARLETFTGKDGQEHQTIGLHVNDAIITPSAGTGAPQTPVNDRWGQVDESTPF